MDETTAYEAIIKESSLINLHIEKTSEIVSKAINCFEKCIYHCNNVRKIVIKPIIIE